MSKIVTYAEVECPSVNSVIYVPLEDVSAVIQQLSRLLSEKCTKTDCEVVKQECSGPCPSACEDCPQKSEKHASVLDELWQEALNRLPDAVKQLAPETLESKYRDMVREQKEAYNKRVKDMNCGKTPCCRSPSEMYEIYMQHGKEIVDMINRLGLVSNCKL